MFKKFRKKLPIILLGLGFLLLAAWLQLSTIPSVAEFRSDLDLNAYDLLLNIWISDYPENPKNRVILVDIDEKSIQKIGRWPWPRNIVAQLVDDIRKAGATIIAFDITFTQPEKNMAKTLLEDAKKKSPGNRAAIQFLENSIPQYDYDKVLAGSLAKGDSILGVAFSNDTSLSNVGQLPPPLLTLDKNSADSSIIYTMLRYRANLPQLQESAKHGGFLTIFPDSDGMLRRVPLILRYGNDIYPSLALETVRQYLLLDKVGLETENIGDVQAVAGIQLGDNRIPTDQYGQVFIPFYKKIRSRQTLSAWDVLNGKLSADQLKNAIILIGSSAPSLNDLHATPVDSVYPGPYIHLEVIRALLTNDFSYRPGWAPAFELLALILIGTICAFLFPFLEAIGIISVTIIMMVGLFSGNIWMLHKEKLIISALFPVLLVGILCMLNLVYGFFFEIRQRSKLKSMFGQYVPKELVDVMNENPKLYGFEGETKIMTVLFSDIRGFTTLSETLSVQQLKELLNHYFTPITEIIFRNRGTIDKYVGDMVMAFWNAPVDDPDHPKNAMRCALEMIEMTEKLKVDFNKMGLPEINIGIGINTGSMNVGDMGSSFRRSYTVLGNAVNLGSRLEGLSKQYGVKIVVGEDTYQNQPDFIFMKLDRVLVKGKTEPTEIYALIGKKEQATPELLREIAQYNIALESYFSKEFTVAHDLFLELKKQYPERTLYELYVDRIEDLLKNPPDENWNGVFEWKIK